MHYIVVIYISYYRIHYLALSNLLFSFINMDANVKRNRIAKLYGLFALVMADHVYGDSKL